MTKILKSLFAMKFMNRRPITAKIYGWPQTSIIVPSASLTKLRVQLYVNAKMVARALWPAALYRSGKY